MKRYFLLLFLTTFLVFNSNFSLFRTYLLFNSGDTVPNRILPFNILSGRGLFFDDFVKLYYPNKNVPYFLEKFGNHYISSYPILPGVISIPIFAPVYYYLRLNHLDYLDNFNTLSQPLEKLSASLFSSLSAAFFFFLMFLVSKNKKTSLLLALAFAFTTQVFSKSSQNLWQHGPANLFLIISQIFLLLGFEAKIKTKYFLASLMAGILSFWSRYTYIIPTVAILGIICFLDKKHFKIYCSVALLALLALFFYSWILYGTILGTSAESLKDFNVFTILSNLNGILFSPARGMLFYTPYYFLPIFFLFSLKKIKNLDFKHQLFLVFNITLLVWGIVNDSIWNVWWGGHTWGNRLLADVAVPAVVLTYYFINFFRSRWIKILVVLLVLYSIVLQSIGVFFYPSGQWNEYPADVDKHPERLWDFSDNPIVRNLAAGINTNGFNNFQVLAKGLTYNMDQKKIQKCLLREIGQENFLNYKIIRVAFKNESNYDWVTTSFNTPNLTLAQIFVNTKTWEHSISYLYPNLPYLIKRDEEVEIKLLIIPPSSGTWEVTILPVEQNYALWLNSCKLIFKMK